MTCSGWIRRAGAVAVVAALAGCGGWEGTGDDPSQAASPAKGSHGKPTQIFPIQLAPAQAFPGEGFGQAVAVTRTALAVADFLGTDHAHVHAYALDGALAETGTMHPDVSPTTCFGEALGLEGDLLAIGAPCAESGGGLVALYAWDEALATWIRTGTLRPPAAGTAGFGKSIAIGTNALAVGAPYEEGAMGAVYVYTRGKAGIGLAGRLTAVERAPWDLFGQALALAGDTLAVTAPGRAAPDALTASGRTHVFLRAGGTWTEAAALTAATALPGEESGWAVAAAQGIVAVTGDRFVAHSVHVFEQGPAGWAELDVEEEERGAADCGFAHAVDLDNGLLAVGMPTMTGPAGEYRSGAVRLYRRGVDRWLRVGEIRSSVPGDKLGHALDVTDGLVAVGIPGTYLPPDHRGSGSVTVVRP